VSARQIENLARRAAEQRAELYGRAAVYDGNTHIRAALTATVSRKTLEEGGFQFLHDARARVVKCGITFSLGKKIAIDGRNYRIDEIRDHPVNPEWVLGLHQL
jgi:predicted DNA-binding protein (UPF0251 family)